MRFFGPSIISEERIVSLKIVHTDKAPAAIGPYSQGIVANGFLFTGRTDRHRSGDGSGDAGQRRRADRARHVESRRRAGDRRRNVEGRREDDDLPAGHERFPTVNEVYGRALGDARPARSTVQVVGLPRSVLVEIEAIVAVP